MQFVKDFDKLHRNDMNLAAYTRRADIVIAAKHDPAYGHVVTGIVGRIVNSRSFPTNERTLHGHGHTTHRHH